MLRGKGGCPGAARLMPMTAPEVCLWPSRQPQRRSQQSEGLKKGRIHSSFRPLPRNQPVHPFQEYLPASLALLALVFKPANVGWSIRRSSLSFHIAGVSMSQHGELFRGSFSVERKNGWRSRRGTPLPPGCSGSTAARQDGPRAAGPGIPGLGRSQGKIPVGPGTVPAHC